MRRILLVSDHPALDRGFATVGRQVAGALHATGAWDVHYLARFVDVDCRLPTTAVSTYTAGPDDLGDVMLPALVARLSRDLPPHQCLLLIVAIGGATYVRPLLRAILEAGLRDRVHFAAYFPVDYAPLPREIAPVFHALDTVLPFTRFGARTIAACCEDAPDPVRLLHPLTVIPHSVDCTIFRQLQPRQRWAVRAQCFGVGAGQFVVGFFGRNVRHKRLDLALSIFRIFAQGLYVVCRRCARVSAFEFVPLTYEHDRLDRCAHCGSRRVRRGDVRPDARLYLHAEVIGPTAQAIAGGWDIEDLCARMGLSRQVLLNRELRIGHGIPATDLAARMAACDVHLLPYEGGAWELTVLETGACGVPNVITDFAAPPEYAKPFSILVPAASYQTQRGGDFRAIIDAERAVAALSRLARSSSLRARLGKAGVATAAKYSTERVGARWQKVLREIDLSSTSPRARHAGLWPLLSSHAALRLLAEP